MEEAYPDIFSSSCATPNVIYSKECKRRKLSPFLKDFPGTVISTSIADSPTSSKVVDYSDPYSFPNLLDKLDSGKFGSVTKDVEALVALKMQILSPYISKYPKLTNIIADAEKVQITDFPESVNHQMSSSAKNFIDLENDSSAIVPLSQAVILASKSPVVIIESDEEDNRNQRPIYPFHEVVLPKTSTLGAPLVKTISGNNIPTRKVTDGGAKEGHEATISSGVGNKSDEGAYVGVEEESNQETDTEKENDDGLGDIWMEMNMALELSKDTVEDPKSDEQTTDDEKDCDHSFVLKDDLGYVCRICGVIDRGIETIFEFQYNKVRSTRTYASESRKDKESGDTGGISLSEFSLTVAEISAHPRHMKQMKPHQIDGFNFLVSNLVTDEPGGCILAHAPGSGKTFMIISFMQSFLAKYPHARPLVVLPKGILAIWKKEFQIWQVEDIPLYDFYSVKADNRSQQLEVLKLWVERKSILFLGYKQFSTIVCDSGTSKTSASCQDILLKAPSILILDEGHTPRNENTDVLQSLAKVQTPRKVVLSGTLYQNHVKEVFNILNLVRPKFLRSESSKSIVKRIMSRVDITGVRRQFKAGGEAAFYDLVEHTLQKDDFKRKVTVIHDLRDMTSKVLHYYKGDFLDELPGLVDFTVVLNLSQNQKHEVGKLKKLERKFKVCSVGSAVYLHPKLNTFSDNSATDDEMDNMLEKLDVKNGVKAKFFVNMLSLCESAGEKLLVFSQYLLPLKFLERLAVKFKGWSPGREIFTITGESNSDQREWSMERFNNSQDSKVFFGSIKACGEGISLVGASRIIILDVHLNPSVTRQAIGRAFRPGQKKKVYAYRLVAADSPEEEDHSTCFKKELIAKMWFEWNEYCGYRDFSVETVDVNECGDLFLESPFLREDVRVLYKR